MERQVRLATGSLIVSGPVFSTSTDTCGTGPPRQTPPQSAPATKCDEGPYEAVRPLLGRGSSATDAPSWIVSLASEEFVRTRNPEFMLTGNWPYPVDRVGVVPAVTGAAIEYVSALLDRDAPMRLVAVATKELAEPLNPVVVVKTTLSGAVIRAGRRPDGYWKASRHAGLVPLGSDAAQGARVWTRGRASPGEPTGHHADRGPSDHGPSVGGMVLMGAGQAATEWLDEVTEDARGLVAVRAVPRRGSTRRNASQAA